MINDLLQWAVLVVSTSVTGTLVLAVISLRREVAKLAKEAEQAAADKAVRKAKRGAKRAAKRPSGPPVLRIVK